MIENNCKLIRAEQISKKDGKAWWNYFILPEGCDSPIAIRLSFPTKGLNRLMFAKSTPVEIDSKRNYEISEVNSK